MTINLLNHPCFNDKVRHIYGRVHLPVAPKCNIQCNFCDRRYDCVNESRPGVTSKILSPYQALCFLDKVMERNPNISVAGIAGPGDPFANPDETMETLRLIRKKYPDILLCLATNGFKILPYIEELSMLKVGHVTITINAIDPEIGAKIYSFVKYNGKTYRGREGFEILLENQLKAVSKLKKNGITVKINTIIIPGINNEHIPEIAKKVSELGANILNCIPLYHIPDTVFANINEPDNSMIKRVRKGAAKYLPQMYHCARCRADAVGLLGKDDAGALNILAECANM